MTRRIFCQYAYFSMSLLLVALLLLICEPSGSNAFVVPRPMSSATTVHHHPRTFTTTSTRQCRATKRRHNTSSSSSVALYMTIPALLEEATTATSSSSSFMTNFALSQDSLALSLAEHQQPFHNFLAMNQDTAEALAGPFFGLSLFPYLAFLYFLDRPENKTPKGVTVGFATCLLFVVLTIPAAIASKLLYGVSLADCDWLHGSAESLLTVTNLVTVVAFRQALAAKEQGAPLMPNSALSYAPMTILVLALTALATVTVLVPALSGHAQVHTPYLNGVLDAPFLNSGVLALGANPEPNNALTIATWIIHVSSLVEFLVAMGFCWRWGDIVKNPSWKGLTWGLLPLHSSGITACTYHLFYNQLPVLVPLQALLTVIGNTTAAYAALRIALSNGWKPTNKEGVVPQLVSSWLENLPTLVVDDTSSTQQQQPQESKSLVGFEDLGDALAGDNDYSFLIKLFLGCAVASYVIKYGETFFDFPYDSNAYLGLAVVIVPSALNAFKWYKRSQDPTFEGWF